jgi:uncharacterized protein YcbK (DUF882 family)
LQTLLGADSTVEHELEDMRRQLARKEEAYNEATALTKNREAQLSAADRAVQILKVASKEREEIMHKRFKQMHDLEVSLLKRIEHLGHEKEHLVAKKDKERVRKLQTILYYYTYISLGLYSSTICPGNIVMINSPLPFPL